MDYPVRRPIWPRATAVPNGVVRENRRNLSSWGVWGMRASMISCASRWSEGATIRMSLDRSDIEKIALLARLAIAEDDIPRYARALSRILDKEAQLSPDDTRVL